MYLHFLIYTIVTFYNLHTVYKLLSTIQHKICLYWNKLQDGGFQRKSNCMLILCLQTRCWHSWQISQHFHGSIMHQFHPSIYTTSNHHNIFLILSPCPWYLSLFYPASVVNSGHKIFVNGLKLYVNTILLEVECCIVC